MDALRHALQVLHEHLRQTGVGALPLIPEPSTDALAPAIPSEAEMAANTSKALDALFERKQRHQESAGVVVNLLQHAPPR